MFDQQLWFMSAKQDTSDMHHNFVHSVEKDVLTMKSFKTVLSHRPVYLSTLFVVVADSVTNRGYLLLCDLALNYFEKRILGSVPISDGTFLSSA